LANGIRTALEDSALRAFRTGGVGPEPGAKTADDVCYWHLADSPLLGAKRTPVSWLFLSVYANDGAQRQEVAIPPQRGRIKAGRAAAIQKQSVLALKLIAEETRELAKRNF
jgi:hypothetical protein